ncbi:MAG: cupin domain-containing protein [Halioglobus sp.]|jgi:uncharacterized cupin superfamily protein|nr:cupin domain-containing protein [Halioglobus sp.]
MAKYGLLRWLLGGLLFTPLMSASGGDGAGPNASPVRLEPTQIAYLDMNSNLPPWPEEDILSGVSEHRYKTLYSGDINVSIYEAKPLKLRLRDYPIDEFVTVVSGKLILTAEGGSPQHFAAGQSVMVPKGFSGTWEMQGNFRELVVIMNDTGDNQQ